MIAEIDIVWARIKAHAGEKFSLVRGRQFTYEVRGNSLETSPGGRTVSKAHIERTLPHVPLANTGTAYRLGVQASYVYAILMDARIRLSDW